MTLLQAVPEFLPADPQVVISFYLLAVIVAAVLAYVLIRLSLWFSRTFMLYVVPVLLPLLYAIYAGLALLVNGEAGLSGDYTIRDYGVFHTVVENEVVGSGGKVCVTCGRDHVGGTEFCGFEEVVRFGILCESEETFRTFECSECLDADPIDLALGTAEHLRPAESETETETETETEDSDESPRDLETLSEMNPGLSKWFHLYVEATRVSRMVYDNSGHIRYTDPNIMGAESEEFASDISSHAHRTSSASILPEGNEDEWISYREKLRYYIRSYNRDPVAGEKGED